MDACTATLLGLAGISKERVFGKKKKGGGLGGWGSDQCVERFLGELKGRGRDTFTPSALLPNDKAASRTPEAPLDAPVTSTLEAHESHLGSVENIHPSVQ